MGDEFLGESLIFLISQPRAGSTLLQRILAGHPLVETVAEPWLMLHPVYALRRSGLQTEYNVQWAYDGLQDFLTHCTDGEVTYLEAIRALAQVLYSRALEGTGTALFLDKTPRYYFIIPELSRLFPRAKFIFLLRNPVAVLASILSTWVGDEWSLLALFRHDLLLAPRRILEGIDLLAERAFVVHYEELVATPMEAVSTLCSQLRLDFSEEMLHYGSRPAPQGRFGDTVGVEKHHAPSSAGLDTWKLLALQQQTRHFAQAYLDALTSDLVEAMGYDWQQLRDVFALEEGASTGALSPWNTVIRPSKNWTRRERLAYAWTIAVQRKGTLRGTVSFTIGKVVDIARSHRADQEPAW